MTQMVASTVAVGVAVLVACLVLVIGLPWCFKPESRDGRFVELRHWEPGA